MKIPNHFQRGCICRGSGMVEVVSDGSSFKTFFGEILPEGRTVIVACNCEFGSQINEHRDPEFQFTTYNPDQMVMRDEYDRRKRTGMILHPTVSSKASDGWEGLPPREDFEFEHDT